MDKGGYLWKENIRFIVIFSFIVNNILEFQAIVKIVGGTEKDMKHSQKWTEQFKNTDGKT